jgi:hypothetical protein
MNHYDNFYEGLTDNRNLLYRQIDTVSTMNKLLSTLCCEINNLKNYRININFYYNFVEANTNNLYRYDYNST